MKARLLVLGMLHRGDLHPYEMKRRAEAAMVGCYLDVDVGTLYYAVRQLEKDGAIATVGQERVARGGLRTVYRITEAGRAEFQRGFYREFDRDGPVCETLYGALLFLHCVDAPDLAAAIRGRIARLERAIAELPQVRTALGDHLPLGGAHLLAHIAAQRAMDLDWLRALLRDVADGGATGDLS